MGAVVLHLPCMAGFSRFKEHDPNLLSVFGKGVVLYATGYDDHFPLLHHLGAVAKLHVQSAFENEESFVFMLMAVPNEVVAKLCEFYLLPVQFPNDVRLPVIGKPAKFFVDIYYHHVKLRILNVEF